MAMVAYFKQGMRVVGVDRAIFFTLITRGWSAGAGLLTIFFVISFLSPEIQGYYYTFYSLIALTIFAELGLNYAIVQFASHEMANLSWTEDGTLSGRLDSKRRLQSLMHFSITWFGVAALLMVVVLMPMGGYFFGASSHLGTSEPNVSVPWLLLVVFTAVNLIVNACIAILEGCGKVAEVAVLRLWQSVFSISSVWVVLSIGGNLYALAANSFMMVVVGCTFLWVKYRVFFSDLFRHSIALPGMNWRSEIWPFQWRIAVSCTSGFFISQLFTPLLFATHGPIVAGQMGMTMQIIGAMNSVAMVWITTKAPTYGQLIANKQWIELDTLFFRGLRQSTYFLVFGVICVLVVLFYLNMIEFNYAPRVLPTYLFTILSVVCIANHISCSEAAYLRAHKQEPFMVLSILHGVATAVLAMLLIPPLGGAGAVYSYAATSLLISLGGGTAVFFRKRREWAGR